MKRFIPAIIVAFIFTLVPTILLTILVLVCDPKMTNWVLINSIPWFVCFGGFIGILYHSVIKR